MSELLDEGDPGFVEIRQPADLPGVELLVAERSVRRWVVLHHAYALCTVLDLARPVPWKYRGRRFDLGGDGCSFMEPGEVHANLRVSDPATFRVLFLEPGLVEKAAAEIGIAGAIHFKLAQIDQASHPQLRRALLAFHASIEQRATQLERESLLVRCLELAFRQCAERAPPPPRVTACLPSVLRAREYIEEHLTEPVRLDELVAAAGAPSRFQLVRSFAATTGLPPHAYQIQRRINLARQLLAHGLAPADIAVRLGFVDQSHFSRHFKRVVAVPPATYQRAVCTDRRSGDRGSIRARPPGCR